MLVWRTKQSDPNEVWLKTSLFKSPTGPIVFCKVIQQQGSLEYDYYSETLSTGECITLDPQTFTPNSINSMNVGVASNVAGAYLGQVNRKESTKNSCFMVLAR